MEAYNLLCYDAFIHSDDDVKRLVAELEVNSKLEKLLISFEEEAHVKEDATVMALTAAIAKARIVTLTLIWQEFESSLHASLARKLMQEAVKKSSTIRNLDLHSMVGESQSLVDAMATTPNLQSLGLYDDWNTQDLRWLGDNLYQTATLQTLTFNGVNLDSPDTMEMLSRGIARNHSIITIIFQGCGISDDGVKAFVSHWRPDSSIQTLEFNSNVIQAEGAMLLIKTASRHTAMDNLYLLANEDIGYEGLANIALELPRIHLKRLNLETCVAEFAAMNPMYDMPRKLIATLVKEGMKHNEHIVKMDLTGNGILLACQGTAEILDFYMARNEYRPLLLQPIALPPNALWCHVFANKFGDDASLIYCFLKDQPLLWSFNTPSPSPPPPPASPRTCYHQPETNQDCSTAGGGVTTTTGPTKRQKKRPRGP